MLDDALGRRHGSTRRRLAEAEARGALEPNDNLAAAIHGIDGIREEIDEHLLQLVALRIDLQWGIGELEGDVDGAEGTARPQQIDRGLDYFGDVGCGGPGWPRPGVIEETAHDAFDAPALTLERRKELELFHRRAASQQELTQRVDVAEHRTEWCSDLVSDARRETADARQLLRADELRLIGKDATRQAIDAGADVLKLADGCIGHASREIAVANLVSGHGESAERLEQRFVEQEPDAAEQEQHDDEDCTDNEERLIGHVEARRREENRQQAERRSGEKSELAQKLRVQGSDFHVATPSVRS